jgi:hypothetical protein
MSSFLNMYVKRIIHVIVSEPVCNVVGIDIRINRFLNKYVKAPLHYLILKRETIPDLMCSIKKVDIIQGEERLKTE